MSRTALAGMLVVFIVLGTFTSVPVAAGQSATLTCDGEQADIPIENVTTQFNQNVDKIPDKIKPFLRSNTTELQIRNASQVSYTIKTNDTFHITQATVGSPAEPDVIILTDRATACSLYTAEDPVTAFQDAYEAGDIEIEGRGLINQAKVFIVERLFGAGDLIEKTLDTLF